MRGEARAASGPAGVIAVHAGWLKAHGAGGLRAARGGRGRACATCTRSVCRREGERLQVGRQSAGRQRTSNMKYMFVTLDVSQLRGWLKAYARCPQGRKPGHTVRGGLRAGRHEAAGERGVHAQHAHGGGKT